MKVFRPLYERVLRWAEHPRAEGYLGLLSFVEAVIFPVPPEVMLAPMVLARPMRWVRYAMISLIGSLLGALVGLALGHYAFGALRPLFANIGWLPHIDAVVAQLQQDIAQHPWSVFWTLVLAGILPVPLKIVTWASGIVGVPLLPFLASILIGRAKRVYLLAGLIRLGGRRAEAALHRWVEWLGWAGIALGAVAVIYFRWVR